jgi:hypothetical protein
MTNLIEPPAEPSTAIGAVSELATSAIALHRAKPMQGFEPSTPALRG